jgi:transcriptional regulator GlxA family with amidase domain
VRIAIPLFAGFTAIDIVGPYEVLWRLPGAEVLLAAETAGPIADDNGALALSATATLQEIEQIDVLVVPGGLGIRRLTADARWLGWIREIHHSTRITASVCTGSLLLAAAGLLDGVEATSHWLSLGELERYGARPVRRRVVEAGRIYTSAGATAGIDLALTLAAALAGAETAQAIQLAIEYDPQPPFRCGSPETAPTAVVELSRAAATARGARRQA